jgi:hypothetical protein
MLFNQSLALQKPWFSSIFIGALWWGERPREPLN